MAVMMVLSSCQTVPSFSSLGFRLSPVGSGQGLVVAGSAQLASSQALLTAATPSAMAGAIWAPHRVWVDRFQANFSFLISSTGSDVMGSDGLALVLWQGSEMPSADSVAPQPGGLGYGAGLPDGGGTTGLVASVALEIDTFPDEGLGDPPQQHLGLHTRGHAANAANSANETARVGALGLNFLPASLRKNPYVMQVEYADKVLRMGVVGFIKPSLVVNIDLVKTLGPGNEQGVWIGLTASKQNGSSDQHSILSWSFSYTGNALAPLNTKVSGSGWSAREVTAGQEQVFYIEALDSYGHPFMGSGIPFTLLLNGSPDGAQVTAMGSNEPGLFRGSYTATVAGATTLKVVTLPPTNLVVASTSLECTPGPFSPSHAILGGQYGGGTVGQQLSFTVTMTDAYGNPVAPSLATIKVSYDPPSGPSAQVQPCGSCNGVYTVNYSSDNQGAFKMTVTVDNQVVLGSPFSVGFSSGDIDPSRAFMSGPQLVGGPVGTPLSFDVQLRDRYSNPVAAIANVTVEFNPPLVVGGGTGVVVTPVDPPNTGRYNVTYSSTRAGHYSMTLKVNGIKSFQSPITDVHLDPGELFRGLCILHAPSFPLRANQPVVFVAEARDRFNNTLIGVPPLAMTAMFEDETPLNGTILYPQAPGLISLRLTVPPFAESPLLIGLSEAPSGQPIPGSPFSFPIRPGPLASCEAPDIPSSLPVGKPFSFTLSPVDEDGVALPDAPLTVEASAGLDVSFEPQGDNIVFTFAPPAIGLYQIAVLAKEGRYAGMSLPGFPRVFVALSSSGVTTDAILSFAAVGLAGLMLIVMILLLVFRRRILRGFNDRSGSVTAESLSFHDTEHTFGASDLE